MTDSGLRVKNPRNPITALFQVYDGWNLVEEYKHPDDTLDSRYLWGAGPGELLSLYTSGQTYYLYQDGRNNTSQIADASAMVQESDKYDLNGTPTVYDPSGNEMPNGSAIGNRFLFGGQEYYQELGLINLRNRFYLPELGRFLQPDPIGFSGDPSNLYRYCGNNPANGSDPMGTTIKLDKNVDRDTYSKAINYLLGSQRFADVYNSLQSSPNVYVVHQIDERQQGYEDAFIPIQAEDGSAAGGDIDWDPYSAHFTGDGGEQSPSLSLAHEFDHAAFFDFDPNISQLLEDNLGLGYLGETESFGTLEEMRDILTDESAIADALGEPTRDNDKDNGATHVSGPTDGIESNIPMFQLQPGSIGPVGANGYGGGIDRWIALRAARKKY